MPIKILCAICEQEIPEIKIPKGTHAGTVIDEDTEGWDVGTIEFAYGMWGERVNMTDIELGDLCKDCYNTLKRDFEKNLRELREQHSRTFEELTADELSQLPWTKFEKGADRSTAAVVNEAGWIFSNECHALAKELQVRSAMLRKDPLVVGEWEYKFSGKENSLISRSHSDERVERVKRIEAYQKSPKEAS